jgi:acid phosphatase (class A)
MLKNFRFISLEISEKSSFLWTFLIYRSHLKLKQNLLWSKVCFIGDSRKSRECHHWTKKNLKYIRSPGDFGTYRKSFCAKRAVLCSIFNYLKGIKTKNFIKLLFAAFISFSLCLEADAKSYFAAEILSPALIDPPLKENSSQRKKEVNYIVNLQNNLDIKEFDQAFKERELDQKVTEEILSAVHPALTKKQNPELYEFLTQIAETTFVVVNNTKNYWNIKRPYLAEKKVKALIPFVNNPSYPSGHTTASYVYANILGQLIPQKRAEFMAIAAKIAQHRVLAGMHYPSDLDGGRQLALLIVGALMENSDFQSDFKKVKKNLKLAENL